MENVCSSQSFKGLHLFPYTVRELKPPFKKMNPLLAQRKINEVETKKKKKTRENILKVAVSLVDGTKKEKTVT